MSTLEQSQDPEVSPRTQEHIVIGTWTVIERFPNLLFWNDPNSYDHDPYLIADISSPQQTVDVATQEVITELIQRGINEEKAKGAIKRAEESGRIVFPFAEDETDGPNIKMRRIPMLFVEVKSSVLQELTTLANHYLYPLHRLHPHSEWNTLEERRVEDAFMRYAARQIPPKVRAV